MKRRVILCARLLVGALALAGLRPASATGQAAGQPLAASDPLLHALPADLRERIRPFLTITDEHRRELEEVTDDQRRRSLVRSLTHRPEAAALVLEALEREPDAEVRYWILADFSYFPHWRQNAQLRSLLQRMIASDASPKVVVQAAEQLRVLATQGVRDALTTRRASAEAARDEEILTALSEEEERWISLERGTMLPKFLRQPPVDMTVSVTERPLRVVAFGDYGTGRDSQTKTAGVLRRYHARHPFRFGITLGDNFYPYGMLSPRDPRWKTQWDDLYGPLGIRFYIALGNHDWYDPDSPAAEILHSESSASWSLPSPYYTFTAGPAQFFAIDSNDISHAQRAWLQRSLDESTARWKVVYGHHPLYLSTPQVSDIPRMVETLSSVLAGRADVYMAGHHHSLQHLAPRDGVHFFIAGGGGAGSYPVGPANDKTLFAKQTYGFADLEIAESTLKVTLVSADDGPVYRYTIDKPARTRE